MAAFTKTLSAVTSTGDLTQIYFPGCTPGGGTTVGSPKRSPAAGNLFQAEVMTDGTNGGTIELWDISGEDCGADVNTAEAITNTQKNTAAALTPSKAVLIWTQTITGADTGTRAPRLQIPGGIHFNYGLAARFIGASGSVTMSFDIDGGFKKVWIAGT